MRLIKFSFSRVVLCKQGSNVAKLYLNLPSVVHYRRFGTVNHQKKSIRSSDSSIGPLALSPLQPFKTSFLVGPYGSTPHSFQSSSLASSTLHVPEESPKFHDPKEASSSLRVTGVCKELLPPSS